MKKAVYILVACLALVNTGCQKDPLDDINDGGWNNERSILSIKFENQVGNANVTRVDDETGTIDLAINVSAIPDMSNVVLQELVLSYGADASIHQGDALNFENPGHTATVTVTSPTGKSRIYTITASPFEENLIGTYTIDNLILYGGTGPEYGGGAVMALTDKPWVWPDTGGPAAELDNTLTFEMTGITDDGNTYGTVTNDPGPDGMYADFQFIGDPATDVNHFYRKIPEGEGQWLRDYSTNTIILTFADGSTTTGTLVNAGTEDLGNGLSKTTTNQAFAFNLNGTDDWDNIYSDYDKFVKRPRRFWIDVTKQ